MHICVACICVLLRTATDTLQVLFMHLQSLLTICVIPEDRDSTPYPQIATLVPGTSQQNHLTKRFRSDTMLDSNPVCVIMDELTIS